MDPDEIRKSAEETRQWFDAYLAVGFTEEQTMNILTRLAITVQMPASAWPPEMLEWLERQTAFFTKEMLG